MARAGPAAEIWGMDTRPPSSAERALVPKPLGAVLGENADIVALAFSALAFLICATSAPDRTCGTGRVVEAGGIFDACAVLSPLALVAAAFAALACRRAVSSKIAAFFLYGGAAVPVFIGLAHAGAPCMYA
jgi:hypothetical protein